MKTLVFARRTGKEILRDPLTLFFGLGFPLILLVLLSAIQKNVPVPLFEIEKLTAWLSGVWFDLELVSGLKTIAEFLPFVHAVKLEQGLLNGDFAALLPHALWVAGYAIVLCAAATALFTKKMRDL